MKEVKFWWRQFLVNRASEVISVIVRVGMWLYSSEIFNCYLAFKKEYLCWQGLKGSCSRHCSFVLDVLKTSKLSYHFVLP